MPDATPADSDPFFAIIRGGEWNACIGKQGTEENYVDGYMEAALELASAVIDKRQYGKRDTLAMPILYNARHSVELALKFVIDRLVEAAIVPQAHPKTHDIKSHWDNLRACDLVRLRVSDVAAGGILRTRSTVIQQKTGRPVPFEITEPTRETLAAWLALRGQRRRLAIPKPKPSW